MEIKKNILPDLQRKAIPSSSNLFFGVHFSDHMLIMKYKKDKGWHEPEITPYGNFSLDPASCCLHYGQAIFEGLKAFRGKDRKLRLFRPMENMKRLNRSAWRLCMPVVDEVFLCEAIKELVRIDASWVPGDLGTSLYIRPFMIATEAFLGVRPAHEYLLSVITCPVGAYYKEGFNPVNIYVTDKYVRSAKGCVGVAKAAGNYAASLMASEEAKELGFTQVLWLDALERLYVEEVGTMNIFFLIDSTLVTPELSGSILPGITRDSVIMIAKKWGFNVEERKISIDEVLKKTKTGELKECFGTGTAAVISPVGSLFYKGKNYVVNGGETGKFALRLFDEITGIQYGEKEDSFGWTEVI